MAASGEERSMLFSGVIAVDLADCGQAIEYLNGNGNRLRRAMGEDCWGLLGFCRDVNS